MLVSLRSFLAEGRFGDVRVGMSKSEILTLAGEPAEFGRGDSLADAEVWINGKTTFWFSGSTLERMGVYYTLDYPSNQNIEYDASFPDGGASLESLRSFMSANGIENSQMDSARHQIVHVISGVQIIAGRDGRLHSMIIPAVD